MRSLKWKVITWFIVGFVLAGLSMYYVFDSFNNMASSIKVLGEPDYSYRLVDAVKNDLVGTENSMRSYMMSGQLEHLDDYLDGMDRIEDNLDSLLRIDTSVVSESAISEIIDLLANRADLMYNLVDLKNQKLDNQFAARTFAQFQEELKGDGSNETPAQVKRDSLTDPGVHVLKPPSMRIDPTEREKSKLKGLFNRKKETDSTFISSVYNIQLETDSTGENNDGTGYIIRYDNEIELEKVRGILNEISREEKRFNAQLNKRELEILASDRLIMGKVNDIMRSVELNNQAQYITARQLAENKATVNSRNIFIMAILALSMGLLLLIALLQDINRKQRYRLQLEESKDYAESLAQARQRFLANMSHEIRTPLNAIIGFAEQLKPNDPRQEVQVEHIRTASSHLLGIVNDVLEYSRLELRKSSLNKESVNLYAILDEVCQILEPRTEEKGISFVRDFESDKPQFVLADPLRLKQVFINIIGNAIKFTEEGEVRVGLQCDNKKKYIDYIVLVSDTGIGIPAHQTERIFEDFSQADDTVERKFGGSGLGLTITRKLIEQHNGNIHVESELDKGTTFIIELRLATAIEPVSSEKKHTQNLNLIKKKNVLVVDDEPFNLELAETILKTAGHEVETCSNAEDALEALSRKEFDVCFVDLHMPVISGRRLAEQIRSLYGSTRIIALTADVITPLEDIVSESGFNDVLYKPYQKEELLSAVQRQSGSNGTTPKQQDQLIPDSLFSVDEVAQFVDDDESLMQEVFESFTYSARKNLGLLNEAFKNGDLNEMGEIAHRMLPSYQHFRIEKAVPYLRAMEKREERTHEEWESALEEVEDITKQVLEALNDYQHI